LTNGVDPREIGSDLTVNDPSLGSTEVADSKFEGRVSTAGDWERLIATSYCQHVQGERTLVSLAFFLYSYVLEAVGNRVLGLRFCSLRFILSDMRSSMFHVAYHVS